MARLTRQQWLEGAFAVLAEQGPDAMGIARLSSALGVTKGSFYWHFDDRQSLLDAMFTTWERHGTSEIIRQVDAESSEPRVRLQHLATLVFGDAGRYDAVESNLRVMARGNPRALEIVERVDATRMTYVTGLLVAGGISQQQAEDRAAVFYRALIGEFTWQSIGGDPLRAEARKAFIDLLFS